MNSEAQPKPEGTHLTQCYRCGAALEEGARVCVYCGRKQYRLCFCGAQIPRSAVRCPECGTDWSKIARRRRHRESFAWRSLASYCAVGAVLSLMVAAALAWAYRRLATAALAHYGAPGEPSVGLVLRYIGEKAAGVVGALGHHGHGMAAPLVVMMLGAGAGALYYAWRLRHARGSRHRKSAPRNRTS